MENTELKKTPYNQIHHDLGAKMAEFAGYDMPIQYTGLVEEHNNVRNNVGVFDVSHIRTARAASSTTCSSIALLTTITSWYLTLPTSTRTGLG